MKLPFAGKFAGDVDIVGANHRHRSGVFGLPCQHDRCALHGRERRCGGERKNPRGPTFTVALAWIWPVALVAVRMYVVVGCGLTVAQSLLFRLLPTPVA